jgi:adenylate cyclase
VLFARVPSPEQALGSALAMATRAVELDPRDAEAHTILGVVALFLRRYDESHRRLETALAIDPNLAVAHMWGGGYYALTGDSANARTILRQALRLNPRDPANYWLFAFFGLAEYAAGQYDEAVGWAEKAIHLYHNFPTAHRLLAASLSNLGKTGRAHAAIRDLLEMAPGTTIAKTRAGVPWKEPATMQRYIDALRRAGLPE